MIKLIATDMDGTFLNSQKQFDKQFFDIFFKLKEKGIKFVVASGNQYQRLYQKFIPMSSDMIFIAENGSLIADGTKVLYKNTIKKEHVQQICEIFEKLNDCFIILCSQKAAYVKNVHEAYKDVVSTYYCSYEFVESFEDIYDEGIMKIAIYDPKEDIQVFLNKVKDQLPEGVKVVTSGNMWMDIQNKNINKGIALTYVQDLFNISPEESMAFGDQMNDYELLQSVKYSYAMENAVDPIKNIAYAICPNNEEQGVIQTIEDYLKNT